MKRVLLVKCAVVFDQRHVLQRIIRIHSRNFEKFRVRALYFNILTMYNRLIAWLTIDKTQKNVISTIRDIIDLFYSCYETI